MVIFKQIKLLFFKKNYTGNKLVTDTITMSILSFYKKN